MDDKLLNHTHYMDSLFHLIDNNILGIALFKISISPSQGDKPVNSEQRKLLLVIGYELHFSIVTLKLIILCANIHVRQLTIYQSHS